MPDPVPLPKVPVTFPVYVPVSDVEVVGGNVRFIFTVDVRPLPHSSL